MPVEWTALAWRVGWTLLAATGAYAVVAWVATPVLVRGVRARNPRNHTLTRALQAYARGVGVVVAAVVATVVAGYGHVLARSAVVVAAVTLAIGVAGQDVFENVVSGAFLVADRNFNVGDWVSWGDDAGVVEVVGLRSTRVRTAANEILTVPNAALTNEVVRNPYARGRYRVSVAVAVADDADVDAARAALTDAAVAVEGVAESPPPTVVAAFGDDAIRLELRAWVRDVSHADVVQLRSTLTVAVRDALAAADVDTSPTPERELSGRLAVESEDA